MRPLPALTLALMLASVSAKFAHAQPPPVTPQDFANAAAGADMYEIRAAQVALTQSQDAAVRGFAQEMIAGHEAMLKRVRGGAEASGLKPPGDSVGADQAMLLSALQSLRGKAFDAAYARQQVLAHHAALATEGAYASSGSDRNLRTVAAGDLPMIKRHLDAAQALRQTTGQ